MNLKCVHLLIYCLNLLEEKVRQRFIYCLDHHLVDRALNEMLKAGRFPGWFSREFCFDSLYARLNGLRECLSCASANDLLRLDGTNFNYHLELSERIIDWLIGETGMDRKVVQALAHELSDKLSKLLSEKQTPA